MAKSYFPCAKCGKDICVSGRNRAEAERRAKYSKSKDELCQDCWKAARIAENEQALVASQAAGLPPLLGSEKQIPWAANIRLTALVSLGKAILVMEAALARHPCSSEAKCEVRDAIALVALEIKGVVDATWWIDHQAVQNPEMMQCHIQRVIESRALDITPTYVAEASRRWA